MKKITNEYKRKISINKQFYIFSLQWYENSIFKLESVTD